MPRLYHGPLQPGKRSAYVKGSRKNYRKKYRTIGTQAGKGLPARLRASKARYVISKEVAKQINSVAENKFVGLVGDCLSPVPKPAGAQPITYGFFNTGEILPPGVSTSFTPMKAFTYTQAERDGRFLYLKHAIMSFEIQMLPRNTSSLAVLNSTTQFRFMVVKQKQYANRLGTVKSPNDSLFLAPDNKSFGLTNTVSTPQMYHQQPINKRDWIVYKDTKFTLSAPAQIYQSSTGAENSVDVTHEKYRVKRNIKFKCPIDAKVLYGDGSIPIDMDSQWLIIIQAIPTSYCDSTVEPNKQWRINYLSTTIANDS